MHRKSDIFSFLVTNKHFEKVGVAQFTGQKVVEAQK